MKSKKKVSKSNPKVIHPNLKHRKEIADINAGLAASVNNVYSHIEQPIILKVKSNRPLGYTESDPIDLFNSIARAYEFENCIHPFISVEGSIPNVSYKDICRDLAGRTTLNAAIKIGKIAVFKTEGYFDSWKFNKKEDLKKGLRFFIKDRNIFGTYSQIYFEATMKNDQYQQNAVEEYCEFFLTNTTIVEIAHVPPGSEFEIYFSRGK